MASTSNALLLVLVCNRNRKSNSHSRSNSKNSRNSNSNCDKVAIFDWCLITLEEAIHGTVNPKPSSLNRGTQGREKSLRHKEGCIGAGNIRLT